MPEPTQKTVLTKKYIWACFGEAGAMTATEQTTLHIRFSSKKWWWRRVWAEVKLVESNYWSNRWRAIIQAFALVFFVLTRTSISKLWYHSRSKTCPQSSVQSCLRKQVQKQMMSLFKTYKSSKPFWPSNWVSIIKVAHFFRKRVRCYKLQELMTMKCLLFVLDSPTSKSCA